MNLNQDDSERDEILHRYFMEELSSEERSTVESWTAESPDNQRLFDEAEIFTKDLKGLAYYRNEVSVEADQSWDQFKKEHKIKSIRTQTASGFLKYAASVVIVAASVFGMYYYQQIPQDQLIAGTDQIQEITLTEGSTISLNKGASLAYQEPFQNNERRVRLEGEAYFDVAPNEEKPFVVEAGDAEVRVLGTQFFVDESEEELEVKVEEGMVLVSYDDIHELLEQGEGITLDLETNQVSKIEEDPIGMNSFWKTRRLVFRLTPLEEVVQIVSEAYGQPVQLAGSTDDCQLTVTFDNESLENVLAVISGTLNYDLTQNQGIYLLTGDGCQ
ncbi:MAG: FecR domain-containing protein [Bacteroidota bacterium]